MATSRRKSTISQSELARRLRVTRQTVHGACQAGGRLASAVHGRGVDPLHPAVLEWLADRSAVELEAPAPKVDDSAALDDEDAEASSALPQLEELAGLTLGELVARHADVRSLRWWIRAARDAEEAGRARMLRLRVQGRLIPVATVEHMIRAVDDAFKLLLSNAPTAIATRIAPTDAAAVRVVVRDLMSQQLKAARDRVDAILASDDPLSPIPAPEESIEVSAEDPPWGDDA